MIYLTTGGNGAGKTLLTLKDVRDQQLKENRPVYFHGFKAGQQLLDWGWQEFDPKKWQDLPDGSICVMDECQNEFPAKVQGELPDYINAVAQHRRRRGFDFWMITPHPSLIHVNIRRLIESPSWHRHLKRTMGGDMVSELKFNYAELKCEQPGAGARGEVKMRGYPKEVYSWYQSASLHTGKKRIPRQVWMVLGVLVAVPLLIALAVKLVTGNVTARADTIKGKQDQQQQQQQQQKGGEKSGPVSAVDYVASHVPRLPDFPNSAPRYDEVTKPRQAPYPAACVSMGKRCDCYTQQATKLHVSYDTCRQIVAFGYFVDWQESPQQQRQQQSQQAQQAQQQIQQAPQSLPLPQPSVVAPVRPGIAPSQISDAVRSGTRSEWAEQLAARNAATVPTIGR